MMGLLDRALKLLSKSEYAANLCIKLRNRSNSVIGYSLTQSFDASQNGEYWLIDSFTNASSKFVDVGANVGKWSEYFLSRNSTSQGLIFEPSTESVGRLRSNLELYKDRIAVRDMAVGETCGEAFFCQEHECGETSSLVTGISRGDAIQRTVKVTRLDDELSACGWLSVDFVKVDTEGYDLNVLLGASNYLARQAISVIQFEYNSCWAISGATLRRAVDYLESFGYQVYALRPDRLLPYNKRWGEFYWYTNFVALSATSRATRCPGVRSNTED